MNTTSETEKPVLEFGDYCTIERKNYGAPNEHYTYKVVGRGQSNYYKAVPFNGDDCNNKLGEMCDVVKVICCGVTEDRVETFRLQDVKPVPRKRGWRNP